MEDALVKDERGSHSSVSTDKSSTRVDKCRTRVDETTQAAVSPRKIPSQCLSVDHGHVHEGARNPEPPVVTTQDNPFQLQTRGRCGKAPPVDSFSGENPEITIEEWLPLLQRVAEWNEWSEQEILIQLAGHLRGRALQEWNLLDEIEKTSLQCAVKVLQNRLEHGNSTIAAQEFRHLLQGKKETVSEFISRLERTFKIAHGKARMHIESKEALLYGQLQEGLLYKLIESPAVSGAADYKSLCMAARNEERRLAELSRRSQRHGFGTEESYKYRRQDNQSGILQTPRGNTQQTNSTRGPLICYNCGGKNHLERNCRVPKSESTGQGGANTRNSSVKQENKGRQYSNAARSGFNTRQVDEQQTKDQHTEDTNSSAQNELSDMLESESDDGEVLAVQAGNGSCCAKVKIHGVPVYGIVDTGADITIIGGKLFKMIATKATPKLKKKDLQQPDKVPRNYDGNTFTLDGKMDLKGSKSMVEHIYIKMDAKDQLLLSESLYRQLGIVSYHPKVEVWKGDQQEGTEPQSPAKIPIVRVKLVQDT